MNIIFFIFIIIVSTTLILARPYYNGPNYNSERESDNTGGSHQKKRLIGDNSASIVREEPEESEHAVATIYEAPRYRKYQSSGSEPGYIHRETRLEHEPVEFEPETKEKREYYDGNPAAKDASIQVILDSKAKKAVAVVENSPNGQEMYDLSGWKNKEDASSAESDQFANQEQVVNLVYPAEHSLDRSEIKYSPEAFEVTNSNRKYEDSYEGNSDYAGNRMAKSTLRKRLTESERSDDSHKKKRNAEFYKRSISDTLKSESEKRSAPTEKRKADNQIKSDTKQNDCPPHNSPSSSSTDVTNKDSFTSNVNKDSDVKREVPHWSQEQINALTNSVSKARENSAELDNLKAILSEMGLVDNSQLFTQKREIDQREAEKQILNEKLDAISESKRDLQSNSNLNEDEDLNQDNLILRRSDRQANDDEKWELNIDDAPQEPLEKRDADTEIAEEENEDIDNNNSKTVKRSNEESDIPENQNSDLLALDVATSRKKRQNPDKKEDNTQDTVKNLNSAMASANINEDNTESNKKYNKREVEEKSSKEKRKLDGDEYEKRMENQIQAKIDEIKDKVKREILEEQSKTRAKRYTSQTSASDYNSLDSYKPYLRLRRDTNSEISNDKSSIDLASNPSSSSQSKSTRKKRANLLPEKQMVYRPFQQGEQDEEGEEDLEFDDNTFDNRLEVQKRQTGDDDLQYFDSNNYNARNRRSFENDYNDDSPAFHDGGMVVGRKAALKNKNFNDREKRGDSYPLEQDAEVENSDENENMENSDSEYFGSLPQSYNNGELTRYKRVKRDDPYK